MPKKTPKCICCGKEMGPLTEKPKLPEGGKWEPDAWYNPLGGVFIESVGGNYGSAKFDEAWGFGDNIRVLELVVCDDCLEKHPDRWRVTECKEWGEVKEELDL